MRRILLALAMLLALMTTWATAANARDFDVSERQGHLSLGLTGGLTQPVGQLGRDVNMEANVGDSGLNLDWGLNGGAFVDYFLTNRWAIGGFVGTGKLHMKDLTVQTGGGSRTYSKLVEGQTTMLGGYAKYFMNPRGSWSPYVYLGAAHVDREAHLSQDILELYPGATVFDIRDDRVGWVGGLGADYAWTRTLHVGVVASYDYSGELDHDFPWMGHQTVVRDWSFVTLHAVLTYRLAGNP